MDKVIFAFFGSKDSNGMANFFDTNKKIPEYGYAYVKEVNAEGDLVGDVLKLIVEIEMEGINPISKVFDWIPIKEEYEFKGVASDDEKALLDMEHPQSPKPNTNLLPNNCLFYI
ncbi:hypothetical protein L0F16_00170 [Klebsiella pneumoniae]|nr:hypothetical protein [Klebsiella pneumoniae]